MTTKSDIPLDQCGIAEERTGVRQRSIRYEEIKNDLKVLIVTGELRPGEKLPSEKQLTERYNASRVTVRQALDVLQSEQLIESFQCRGHFVKKPAVVQSLASYKGLREALSGTGHNVNSRIVKSRELMAGKKVAEALDIDIGDDVVELQRVRYLNQEPASFDISYFRRHVGLRLLKEDLSRRDLVDILESELGIPIGSAEICIGVTVPHAELLQQLQLEEGIPVLMIERIVTAEDGRKLQYELVYARTDAYQFRVHVPR